MLSCERPCSCGGSNENCFRCDGWGYIKDSESTSSLSYRVPYQGGVRKNTSAMTKNKITYSPESARVQTTQQKTTGNNPTQPASSIHNWGYCKLCSVRVKQIDQHMEKMHPGFLKRLEAQKAAHALKGTSKSAPRAKTKEGKQSPWKRCVKAPEPASSAHKSHCATGGTELIPCPHCKAKVKPSRLPSHLMKVHSKSQMKTWRSPTQNNTAIAAGESGTAVRSMGTDLWNRDPMDQTRPYAHAFRDNGLFGSHPSHDDFSDDGYA